jgi:DNA-binding SARP family transcriptional activator/tetratricopeptide (TPR) repeat protein
VEPRFRILGSTRLRIGDQFDDEWGSPKLRGILGVLLLHPGQPLSIQALIDWVWPEGREPREHSTVYTYVKRIREALNRMSPPVRLSTESGTYRVELARGGEIDYFEFRAATDQARAAVRAGNHELAERLITGALDLWTGTPLADAQGSSAVNWRVWVQHNLLIPAHDLLLQSLYTQGKLDEVLHRLADLPVEHQAELMLVERRLEALHGLHRHQEATNFYLVSRKRFNTNVQHEEADELKRFYEKLVSGSPDTPTVSTDTIHVPNLLPHDIKHFAGRERLLRQLDAMATSVTGDLVAGIVVLDGPPGVGKTALAVHWAHRVAHRFPGGILYIGLNGFANGPPVKPGEAVDNFLTGLGFPVERIQSGPARAAKLRSLLSGRRVLAILDNAADADQILPLLDPLASCLIVITSRHRLSSVGRRGAVNLSVPPLSFREAKSWLAERVGQRAANEPDALAELAALCQGIPLALRGIADRVVARPRVQLAEFVAELRDTPNLLGLGDDGSGAESVRTVVSWSYRNLTPDQQLLFRQLGLHPGPDISLDAAAALAGRDRAQTKHGLDVLVSAHLLAQPESLDRYRFHDLLRKYAAECGAAAEYGAERSAAELRMLSFYLHSANNADITVIPNRRRAPMPPVRENVRPIAFPNDTAAIQWCLRERANLAAIVRYGRDCGALEYVYSLISAIGEIWQRLGYYEDVLAGLTVAIDSARAAGDPQAEAYSLSNFGYIQLSLREFDSAESAFRLAKERFDQIGFRFGSAAVLLNQARLRVARGELKEGIEAHLQALVALRQSDVDGAEINSLYWIADSYRQAGNLSAATSFASDSLFLATKQGDSFAEARALVELGTINYEQGNLPGAKGYLIRALELHGRMHATQPATTALNLLAAIHRDDANPDQAEECAQLALDFARKIRDPRAQATALITLAELAYTQARRSDAAEALSAALAILEDVGDSRVAAIRAQLAEVEVTPSVPATRTEPLVPKRSRSTPQ